MRTHECVQIHTRAQEFIDEIKEQYSDLRDEFYASLEDRKYLSLAEAQKRRLVVDWKDPANKPVKPKVLGNKVLLDFPIEDLLEYIDWNPFFQVRESGRCGAIMFGRVGR
jgi:5-methyltetrahydrofolate--homocysteine methyltransferase